MGFPQEYVRYGVVKVIGNSYFNWVGVWKNPNDYLNLQGFSGSNSAESAMWQGDVIIVRMRDGEVRRYKDFNDFDRI